MKMRRSCDLRVIRLMGRLNSSLATFIFLTFLLFLVANVPTTDSFKTVRRMEKLSKKGLQPVSHSKLPFPFKGKKNTSHQSHPTITMAKLDSFGCPNTSSKAALKCRKRKKQQETLRKSDISKVLKGKGATSSSTLNSYLIPFNIDNSYRSNISNVNKNSGLPPVPKSLLNVKQLTPKNLVEINKFIRDKRSFCKSRSFKGFSCQKLKFSTWLAKQFERNSTKLSSWLEIVKLSANETEVSKRSSSSSSSLLSKDLSSIKPDYWPEKIVYRLIRAWGDPEDLFVFYKYKDYVKSRELKISLPYQVELKVSPKVATELEESARTALSKNSEGVARLFWDPGFNLKLKLPFFRDELKVAVSTGPSFVAGIGVGIAILIVKSMFAPFLLGLKWMMYNVFFKESSPFELMKMLFLSHAPDSWDGPPIPPQSIDHYRPPPIHNHYDHHPHPHPHPHGRPFRGPPPPPRHHYPPFYGPHPPPPPFRMKHYGPPPPPPPIYASHTSPGANYHDFDHHAPPPFDLKYQYSDTNPTVQQHTFDSPDPTMQHTFDSPNPTISQLEQLYRAQLLEEGLGLKRPLNEPDPTNAIDIGETDAPAIMDSMDVDMEHDPHDSQSYIPSTGLQAEVEHFDPFYSPLLSKIDSIFTHLGHNDEGCRERVVCSIYKFPVKYAPYSNLISAQLSKHQSELKRPVTPSPKILRYFRYMKAAKDGQGGENCLDLYPKCNSDTDSVSSLPMITTFHQLSELMTAEPASPAMSLTSS